MFYNILNLEYDFSRSATLLRRPSLCLYIRWWNCQWQGKGQACHIQTSPATCCRWICWTAEHLIWLGPGGGDIPSSISWKSPSHSGPSCWQKLIYTSEAWRIPPTAEGYDVGRGNKWWRYQRQACLLWRSLPASSQALPPLFSRAVGLFSPTWWWEAYGSEINLTLISQGIPWNFKRFSIRFQPLIII